MHENNIENSNTLVACQRKSENTFHSDIKIEEKKMRIKLKFFPGSLQFFSNVDNSQ